MGLRDKLNEKMVNSMRYRKIDHDAAVNTTVLRNIIGIIEMESSEQNRELNDSEIVELIKQEIEKLTQMAETYESFDLPERATDTLKAAEILQKFLTEAEENEPNIIRTR